MRLVKEHPELYEELGHDAFFDRYADAAEGLDERAAREEADAYYYHDRWPGRWPSSASPAHMGRDLQREREEDKR